MKRHRIWMPILATLSALCTAAAVHAQPASVENVTFVPAAGSLERLVDGRDWLAYRVPLVAGGGTVCCYDRDLQAGCRLRGTRRGRWFGHTDVDQYQRGNHLLVFVAPAGAGDESRVQAYDSGCPIDADGARIQWLGDLPATESINALGPIVARDGKHSSALVAIAHHAGNEATDYLATTARNEGLDDDRRAAAAFWLGAERGDDGYQVLDSLVQTVDRPRLREELVTALAQSDVPAAIDRLIDVARTDRSAEVRSQGLFWLAQTASQRATSVLLDAVDNDPETKVQEHAVFAIGQLPSERSVPLLIDLAQNHNTTAVREQAIFWLGQSEDPKALAFIVGLLGR